MDVKHIVDECVWHLRVRFLGKQTNIELSEGFMQNIHYVPWKRKIVMEVGKNGSVNPVEENMNWVDAAKVAAILTLVQFFTEYSMQTPFPYPGCTMIMLQAWCIQGAFYILRQFFVLFSSLTGLTLLGSAALKKKKEE